MPNSQGTPTLRDIAQLVGVSIATASAALNGSGRVSADTRARVAQAAEALKYVPNLAARSLHRVRTNVIGVLVGHLSPASFEIVTGINVEGRAQGRQLLISTTEIDALDEARRVRDLAGGLADGLILIAPVSPPERLADFRALDVPIVLANYRRQGSMLPIVYGENIQASAALTEHLLALGHRRIAFVRGTITSGQSDERERGFRLALAKAGISVDESLVYSGDFTANAGLAAAKEIVALGSAGPTAVLGANDQTARGLVLGFVEAGRSVPRDYSVTGFDGAPMERLRPDLTTVQHPFREIGTEATRLLAGLIELDPVERGSHTPEIEIPSHLEIRDSTTVPRRAP
ncbi:LacI family DNA-binding transcriptional regulator [Microbacterium invictum]|uniref:LacI family DNA-binding transcriptional regulator n=1 Tax=Microbacterium invictum TaxID=515415 RepID=A0ABZ0VD13_9MICO|nr:LacI family DNA-binding transcriptional regulator [Microbacterium invictum]WQB70697.1 LacI family DNA-binding transcriptional regulator [Microbacterium invictum]